MEMISAIVYQLTRNLTPAQIKESGFDTYFVNHTTGIYPIAASGQAFSALTFQSTGDPIADLHEDLAADAATLKVQPDFFGSRKPLVLLGFCHFRHFCKIAIPATGKEQHSPKNHYFLKFTIGQAVFEKFYRHKTRHGSQPPVPGVKSLTYFYKLLSK